MKTNPTAAAELYASMIARAPMKPAVRRGAKHPDPAAAEARAETANDLLQLKREALECRACAPWLEGELALVNPKIVVMLGASAAQAMLGRSAPVMKRRGRVFDLPGGRHGLVTVHPSYLLRLQGDDERHEAYQDFVKDLKLAVRFQAETL